VYQADLLETEQLLVDTTVALLSCKGKDTAEIKKDFAYFAKNLLPLDVWWKRARRPEASTDDAGAPLLLYEELVAIADASYSGAVREFDFVTDPRLRAAVASVAPRFEHTKPLCMCSVKKYVLSLRSSAQEVRREYTHNSICARTESAQSFPVLHTINAGKYGLQQTKQHQYPTRFYSHETRAAAPQVNETRVSRQDSEAVFFKEASSMYDQGVYLAELRYHASKLNMDFGSFMSQWCSSDMTSCTSHTTTHHPFLFRPSLIDRHSSVLVYCRV